MKILAILLVLCMYTCDSRNSNEAGKGVDESAANTGAVPIGSNAQTVGTVEANTALSLSPGKTVKEKIEGFTFGSLTFVVPTVDGTPSRSRVSVEATSELENYVKIRLTQCASDRPEDATAATERDMESGRAATETKQRLIRLNIETLEGRRSISHEEAGELIKFASLAAANLCEDLNLNTPS